MQLDLIDPREHPPVTEKMLSDPHLRRAISTMRPYQVYGTKPWPFVEHLCDVSRRPAWAVDDHGTRFVVIGKLIFRLEEFGILDATIRTAACAIFERLDAIGAAA